MTNRKRPSKRSASTPPTAAPKRARPGRPRAGQSTEGLTTGEVARRLRCSRSNIHRLRIGEKLRGVLDDEGHYRFQLEDVMELARELRRPVMTDGAMAKKVYEEVLRRGLKLSKKAFLEIVLATNSDPHTVGSLLAQL
jgi:hypothetical protein